jgi:hypothetical protein
VQHHAQAVRRDHGLQVARQAGLGAELVERARLGQVVRRLVADLGLVWRRAPALPSCVCLPSVRVLPPCGASGSARSGCRAGRLSVPA